jgi:hypothetical protein
LTPYIKVQIIIFFYYKIENIISKKIKKN